MCSGNGLVLQMRRLSMAIIAWACRCIERASRQSFQVLMTPTDCELS